MTDAWTLVGLAAFGTAAAVMLAWCVVEIARGTSSQSWPHVIGTLLRISLKESGGEVGLYRPDVFYSYRVEGNEYCGERFQFGQFFLTAGSVRWAEEQVRGLAVGSPVDVYYNPARPFVSTLRQGVTWRAYLWAAIATLIVTLTARQFATLLQLGG